jgi:hypothetical protein
MPRVASSAAPAVVTDRRIPNVHHAMKAIFCMRSPAISGFIVGELFVFGALQQLKREILIVDT